MGRCVKVPGVARTLVANCGHELQQSGYNLSVVPLCSFGQGHVLREIGIRIVRIYDKEEVRLCGLIFLRLYKTAHLQLLPCA